MSLEQVVRDHEEMVKRFESQDFEAIAARLSDPRTIRLLHAAMGLVTEASEFLDVMKKFAFYGKPIDRANLIEELGDGNWYEVLAIDELETTFEQILKTNTAKLTKRYGNTFTSEAAINRNLEEERKILDAA